MAESNLTLLSEPIILILFVAWVLVLIWLAGLTLFLIEIYRKIITLSRKDMKVKGGRKDTRREPRVASVKAEVKTPVEVTTSSEQSPNDIPGMVGRVKAKYNLNGLTLATGDGLVIATTEDDGEKIAARYSHLFRLGKIPNEEGVEVFGTNLMGLEIIGIARMTGETQSSSLHNIKGDIDSALGSLVSDKVTHI
ncbi:MAG: hypothetical protein NT074_05995 [Methanomicrobiales archaeon]|nr:hypothetical protein [Methanomicrobiales archaeon]